MASNDGFFKGFVIGGLIGGFVGLLLAPKTGKEFREELSEESGKFFDKAKKDLEMATKAAAHSYEKGRDKFMEKIADTNLADDEPAAKKKQTTVKEKKENAKPSTKSRKKTSPKK